VLIAGLPISVEDLRHQVVYEITVALLAPRGSYPPLYRRDKSPRDAGLTGLTGPIGYFTCASLTRRAYDVPASATVAER
jgi:hypothetical protein